MNNTLKIRTVLLEKCPVCFSNKINKELEGYDFETHTGKYDIYKCEDCLVSFTNPQPILEDIPKLYENRSTSDFPKIGKFVYFLRSLSIKPLIKKLSKLLPNTNSSIHILDYGCGDGLFSVELSKSNKDFSIVAADFHSNPPYLLENNPHIQYHDFNTLHSLDIQFDLIICRHVLEHTTDPNQFITKIKSLLKPSGYLFLEFPNDDSIWRLIFKRYYCGLYLPRHLIHFNIFSTINFLNKFFNNYYIKKKHTPYLGRSFGYLLNKDISNIGIFGLSLYPVQVIIDKILGKSTTIQIIAQNDP